MIFLKMKNKNFIFLVILFLFFGQGALAAYHFSNYKGKNPIHIYKSDTKIPQGISPDQIKKIYNLQLHKYFNDLF